MRVPLYCKPRQVVRHILGILPMLEVFASSLHSLLIGQHIPACMGHVSTGQILGTGWMGSAMASRQPQQTVQVQAQRAQSAIAAMLTGVGSSGDRSVQHINPDSHGRRRTRARQ